MTISQPEPRRRRISLSVGLSVLLHLVVLGVVVLLVRNEPRFEVKRGEPLFVELPGRAGPAPRGNPAERAKQASRGRRSAGAPPALPGILHREAPPTAPPAIKEIPAPEPRVARVPRPEAPPVPPVKERVAPVPRPEPRMARPEPSAPPAVREKPDLSPTGPPLAKPEPNVAKAPASAPAPAPQLPATRPESNFAKTQVPAPPVTKEAPVEPLSGSPPEAAEGSRTPAPGEPGDRLAALRPHDRGGGLLGGRGGIEGEPIPLDTKDPRFNDYFEQLRRAIKDKWSYPREAAEKNIGGQLVLEFGIAKDGQLRFIELRRTSGVAVLDDYAINAVKLASPFPRVPDGLSRSGIPVVAVFNYIVEGSLYKFLR